MQNTTHWRRWAAAAAVGLLVTNGVAAQSPPAAKAAPPPQVAKPATKSVEPAFKLVLEPRAMELLKATSARLAAATLAASSSPATITRATAG